MFRAAHCIGFFTAIAIQAHAEAAKIPDAVFDYVQRMQGGFVEGALDSEYEVVCGYATHAQISDAGYLSIYKRVYWLLGTPYDSWNFDVRVDFPDAADVKVSLMIDGHKIDYPETITIANGIAGSGSDLCKDGLSGYCPNQLNAELLREVGRRLASARTLVFIVSSQQKIEQLTMRADFGLVLTEIDACIGRLLSKSGRSTR